MTLPQRRFEPWVWGAFALLGLTAASTAWVATRPGGPLPPRVYRWAPVFLGGTAGVGGLAALVWASLHRPWLRRGRLWGWTALVATLWGASAPIPYPSSHEGRPGSVALELPFEGEWTVEFAGDRPRANPLVLQPATRFGVSFRRPRAGRILAPAEGVVRFVEAGFGGRRRVGLELIGTGERVEILEFDGLLEQDLEVAPGERVGTGQALGRTEALVLFLHDPAGEGIPLRWRSLGGEGRSGGRDSLRPGMRVEAGPGTPGGD